MTICVSRRYFLSAINWPLSSLVTSNFLKATKSTNTSRSRLDPLSYAPQEEEESKRDPYICHKPTTNWSANIKYSSVGAKAQENNECSSCEINSCRGANLITAEPNRGVIYGCLVPQNCQLHYLQNLPPSIISSLSSCCRHTINQTAYR